MCACVKVLIRDGLVSQTCSSQGDPHVTTFDGKSVSSTFCVPLCRRRMCIQYISSAKNAIKRSEFNLRN